MLLGVTCLEVENPPEQSAILFIKLNFYFKSLKTPNSDRVFDPFFGFQDQTVILYKLQKKNG
jgi:hypothetical protein